MSVFKKKKKFITSFQYKENKNISKDACNKNPKGFNHIRGHYVKKSF